MGADNTVAAAEPVPGRVWNARCGSSKPLMVAALCVSSLRVLYKDFQDLCKRGFC
jgi:hypothetical protein